MNIVKPGVVCRIHQIVLDHRTDTRRRLLCPASIMLGIDLTFTLDTSDCDLQCCAVLYFIFLVMIRERGVSYYY